jgi:hypothetical protein
MLGSPFLDACQQVLTVKPAPNSAHTRQVDLFTPLLLWRRRRPPAKSHLPKKTIHRSDERTLNQFTKRVKASGLD